MTITAKSILKLSLAGFIVLGFGGYGLYQARILLAGPTLTVTSPTTGTNVSDPLITIRGQAEHISDIRLNDRKIFMDPEGRFAEQLLLPEGYTIMKLEAIDKFGRSREQLIELTYVPRPPAVTLNSITNN